MFLTILYTEFAGQCARENRVSKAREEWSWVPHSRIRGPARVPGWRLGRR